MTDIIGKQLRKVCDEKWGGALISGPDYQINRDVEIWTVKTDQYPHLIIEVSGLEFLQNEGELPMKQLLRTRLDEAIEQVAS